MKRLILLIFTIFISFNLYSQEWAKTYTGAEQPTNGLPTNTVYNTVCDSQGNIYFVGTFGLNASYDGIPLLDAPLYNNAISLVVAKLDSSGNMLWRKAIKNYSNYPVMLANNCLKIIGDTSIVFLVQYMNLARNDHSYFLYYLDTLVRVPQNESYWPDYPFSAIGGHYGSMLITLDLDGNLKSNHFLERRLLVDNNQVLGGGALIDYQGAFDIDKDGYIYIYTRTNKNYSYPEIADSVIVIVDKERRFGYNIPYAENLTLFKFSPDFEEMVWCRSLAHSTISYGMDSVVFMPIARGIDIDSSGNIYITGFLRNGRDHSREGYGDSSSYSEVIVCPDNPNQKIKIAPTDSYTGFIIKYSSDGEVLWTNQMYGQSREPIGDSQFCDISNVVASDENNAVYFLGYGALLGPRGGGRLYFDDSIPLRKYHDSTTNQLFFAKLDMETGSYISHGIAPSSHATSYGYNYNVTNPSFTVRNNQVFAQATYGNHLKGNDTNYYGSGYAFMRWKDNGYIIETKNFPLITTNWNYTGVKNTLVNDRGELILTGMFSNNIHFENIQLTGGSNSNAYIVKYGCDSSYLVPFEGGRVLNDQKPTSFIEEVPLTNNQIIIYPNPTKDDIHIVSTNEIINSYSISNINGQTIINREKVNTNKERINLTSLPKGVYILKVITDKNVYTRKVVRS